MLRRICISIPADMVSLIKEQARKERRTVSEVSREALRRYLESASPEETDPESSAKESLNNESMVECNA
jgi:metal-responsive CopG/Arc/MetJ family transcriptional regulator